MKRLNCIVLAKIIFVAIVVFRTIYMATIKLGRSSSSLDKHVVYEAEFLPIKSQRQILDEQIASYPRRPPNLFNVRSIDESKLPYQCGIIFFYHIACTGGSAINKWLVRLKKLNANTTYFTDWGRHMGVQQRFVTKMEKQVKDFGQHDWRIVHAHGFSLHLNTSEPYLYKWREEVERQGCAFVATTMLQDAIGHTISQHKGMILYNQTVYKFTEYLEPRNYNKVGNFRTQLDYFLYNGDRNKYNATTIEKVRRAIEILRRHFDIVLLSDHDRYNDIIFKITGWIGKSIRRSNTFKGELNFTERELYRIKTLTEMNGDVMFIDAVKHIYYGYLDYLVA